MTIRPISGRRPRDLTLLVALGAALWGVDGWLRGPMTDVHHVAASTIVFGEHLVLVLVTIPFWPRAFRAFRSLDGRGKVAVAAIGIGASAIATTLFTKAFDYGDYITPIVLQKLQPLVAIALAAGWLKEKLHVRFIFFLIPALVGGWLMSFGFTFHVSVDRLSVALLSLSAAAIWGAGTVLGRFVAPQIAAVELTTLRFAFGLPAALVIVLLSGTKFWVQGGGDSTRLIALALIPGLLAMVIYYLGLQRTPASRATLAELAYPVTGAVVGVLALHQHLSGWQWAGLIVVVAAVTLLGLHESRARRMAVEPDVAATADTELALL